jgi:hypothetical protein
MPRPEPTRSLLLPGPGPDWELWTLSAGGKPSGPPRSVEAGKVGVQSCDYFLLPASAFHILPLWLVAADPETTRDLARLQMESRGLVPPGEDPVLAVRPVAREGGRQLVLALVLKEEWNGKVPAQPRTRFDILAGLFPWNGSHFGLWMESGRLVFGAARDGRLAYVQALNTLPGDPGLASEILCLRLLLQAEDVVPDPSGMHCWTDLPTEVLADLRRRLALEIRSGTAEAPVVARMESGLVPRPVKEAVEAASRRRKRVRFLALVAAVYVLAVIGFSSQWIWNQWQIHTLETRMKDVRPVVEKLKETARLWNQLEEAIDPEFYPVETLFQVTSMLPPDGVRLTLFEIRGGRLLLTGEARSAAGAVKFAEDLKENPALSGFQWKSAPPRLLPNDMAQFQIEGERGGGGHGKN